MQSNNGDNAHRNFELLLAASVSKQVGHATSEPSFTHLSRDGTFENWSVVSQARVHSDGTDIPTILGQPAIIGTSYNSGEFHAIARDSKSNIQHWVLSNTTWKLGPAIKGAGPGAATDGYPGFIQADDSSLAMVVRHSDGSLQEVSCTFQSPIIPYISLTSYHPSSGNANPHPKPIHRPNGPKDPSSPTKQPKAVPPSSNLTSAKVSTIPKEQPQQQPTYM